MGSNNSKVSYMDKLIPVIEEDNVSKFCEIFDKDKIKVDEIKFAHRYTYNINYIEQNCNEIICLICIIFNSIQIFSHITKNFELNYQILFKSFPEFLRGCSGKNMQCMMKNIFMKVKDKLILTEDIVSFLIYCDDKDIIQFFHCYRDKEIFNSVLKSNIRDDRVHEKLLKFADDEELIDNKIVKLYFFDMRSDLNIDNFHLLSNPNRVFSSEMHHIVNEYGLLVVACFFGFVSYNSIELVPILIDKGAYLKVVKLVENHFQPYKINIDNLKLLEDMENFNDFLSLNRRLFLSKAKTDEEVDYITSRI